MMMMMIAHFINAGFDFRRQLEHAVQPSRPIHSAPVHTGLEKVPSRENRRKCAGAPLEALRTSLLSCHT